MPPKKHGKCPCGFEFVVVHHRSASFWGLTLKDSKKNRLESTTCPRCKRKLALNTQGFNPLSLEN